MSKNQRISHHHKDTGGLSIKIVFGLRVNLIEFPY
jgi:hypothetical protein